MKTLLFLLFVTLARGAVVSVGQSGITANLLVGSNTGYAAGALVYGGTGSAISGVAGKILLLDRGGNTFAEKAAAAVAAGAVGLVIADNVAEANFAGQLLPAGTTSPIPVLLVSQADGANIKAKAGALVAIGPNFAPLPLILSNLSVVVLTSSSGTARSGAPVVLVAAADGTPPLTFQWAKDGTVIDGATAQTLAVPAFGAGDAGAYTCTASNASGSATSGPYTLTVAP